MKSENIERKHRKRHFVLTYGGGKKQLNKQTNRSANRNMRPRLLVGTHQKTTTRGQKKKAQGSRASAMQEGGNSRLRGKGRGGAIPLSTDWDLKMTKKLTEGRIQEGTLD